LNPFRKADFSKVEVVIDALYYAISFDEGKQPYWSLLESLFIEKARLVHARGGSYVTMELEEFITSFMKQHRMGAYKSFHETELHRVDENYGSIHQAFSTYQTRYTSEEGEGEARGINSIQLVFEDERWWISSMLWFDEDDDSPIPARYLGGS
jgi:hypothetical protein